MKTRITILAILFVLFDIVSSNAFDEQEQTQPGHNPFPEMNRQNQQYPPGFEDMNDIKGGAARLMKKGDAIQSNPDYLVESVQAYRTDGIEFRYTYTYNENKQILTQTLNKWENEE